MTKKYPVKILVTTALLAVLLYSLDYREILQIIKGLRQPPLLAGLLLVILAVILSAYKWQVLLAVRGWKLSVITLTRVYFVGLFMNNFLPSGIGGDVMRIYQVGKKINNHAEAAASVILERVLAAVGLALPVLFAILPNYQLMGRFSLPVISFFAFCVALIYICLKPSVLRPLGKLSWQWWQKALAKMREINAVIRSYRSKPLELIKVVFYSVMFQMAIVLINYCLLKAMNINHVSLWHCTLMVPVISAVSMIPVSINGLGIREGAYVLLFGTVGLTPAQAVTLSMLFFVIVTVTSLPGGLFFLTEKGEFKDTEILLTAE